MSTTINHEQFVLDGDYQTSVQKLEAVAAAVPAFTILGKKTNDGAVTRTAVVVAAGAGTGGKNTGTGTLVADAQNPILEGAEDGAYLIKCKSAADSSFGASAPVQAGAGEAGANIGTGTLVLDETTPVLTGAKSGEYLVKCVSAAVADPAADAVFNVYDPEGAYIGKTDAGTDGDTWAKHIKFVITDHATGDGTVPFAVGDGFSITVDADTAEAVFEVFSPDGGLMGSIDVGTTGAVWSNRIKFAITDKATAGEDVAFIAGDAFTFTVASTQAPASNDLAAWNPDATDGSEVPYGILAAEAPKNEAAQYVSVFISGRFNADKVVVPTDVDVDTAFDALRDKGIYLIHQADTERNPAVVEE